MDKLKRFAVDYVTYVVKGSPAFYAWIAFLCLFILCLLYGTWPTSFSWSASPPEP